MSKAVIHSNAGTSGSKAGSRPLGAAAHPELPASRALSLKDGGSMRCHQVLIISLTLTIGGCAASATPVASPPIAALPMPVIYAPPQPPKPTVHEVTTSWYGNEFAGRPTTSGEPFNPRRLTAASITLPLGSVVKVENPKNGRSVRVRINDCGPFCARQQSRPFAPRRAENRYHSPGSGACENHHS